jgi:hypothetical protein
MPELESSLQSGGKDMFSATSTTKILLHPSHPEQTNKQFARKIQLFCYFFEVPGFLPFKKVLNPCSTFHGKLETEYI